MTSYIWSARGAQVLQGSFLGNQPRIPGQLPRQGQPLQLPSALLRPRPHNLGQRLPEAIQRKAEALFGTEFSDVRLHVGGEAASIGARAFTLGPDIYLAHGQYDPASPHSQRLLGHELAHVLQQRTGRVRNPFGTGIAVVHDGGLEAEAERMGLAMARVLSSERTPPSQPAGRAQLCGPHAVPVHSRPVQAKPGGYAKPKPPAIASRQGPAPACVQRTTLRVSNPTTEVSSTTDESVLKTRPQRQALSQVTAFKVVKIDGITKARTLNTIKRWIQAAEKEQAPIEKEWKKLSTTIPDDYYGQEQSAFREQYKKLNYKRKQLDGSIRELNTIYESLAKYQPSEHNNTEWYRAEANSKIQAIVEIFKDGDYICNLATNPENIVSPSAVRGAGSALIGLSILKALKENREVELYALTSTVKDVYWRLGFDVVKDDQIVARPVRSKVPKAAYRDSRPTAWHSEGTMKMTSESAQEFLKRYGTKEAISNLTDVL